MCTAENINCWTSGHKVTWQEIEKPIALTENKDREAESGKKGCQMDLLAYYSKLYILYKSIYNGENICQNRASYGRAHL